MEIVEFLLYQCIGVQLDWVAAMLPELAFLLGTPTSTLEQPHEKLAAAFRLARVYAKLTRALHTESFQLESY